MKTPFLIPLLSLSFMLLACDPMTGTQQSTTPLPVDHLQFVGGTRAARVNLGTNSSYTNGLPIGSFAIPLVAPTPTMIPIGYPGFDGVTQYQPGVSATTYFEPDGSTILTKPSWIKDIQLGITNIPGTHTCASFAASGESDGEFFYRVSETDCGSVPDGAGAISDPVMIRIILDRDTAYFGTKENLMLQIEYQATGLRLNSDGIGTLPEQNLDYLWKVFWGSTLNPTYALSPYSVFIPPVFATHCAYGSGDAIGGTGCGGATATAAIQSPVITKQILVPLSAYSAQKVIQISRITGRIHSNMGATGSNLYVPSFCPTSDSPSCLGVIFRAITLIRM